MKNLIIKIRYAKDKEESARTRNEGRYVKRKAWWGVEEVMGSGDYILNWG